MAKLTQTQAEQIAELREKGWSYARLAAHFGVSAAAIHYRCLRLGAVSPTTRPIKTRGPMTFVARDGRTQRRFTAEEDSRLLALEAEGRSIKAISQAMGRANSSVRMRLMALALAQESA